MMISLTSEVVILPNAPPMTTPTAMSMHVAAHGKGLELFKKLLHSEGTSLAGFEAKNEQLIV